MTVAGEIVVVGGKGGTGKTSLSAVLVKLLRQVKLLVIDADPVISITHALGETPRDTIGGFREELIANPRVARDLHRRPLREVIAELVNRTDQGYDLLTMGRAEGKGCFCGINDLLRHGVQTLCAAYDVTLIDCEAGIEQVNRRAVHRIDRLLLVSDTSRRGFEAAIQVRDLAVKYNEGKPLAVHVLVNRVRDTEDREKVEQLARTFELTGVIPVPEDPRLRNANLDGQSLLDLAEDSPAVAALRDLAGQLMALAGTATADRHASASA